MVDLQLGLDYVADDNLTGYRLDRLELLNWGTFDKVVWTLDLQGRNTLLTGEIGTGKSTLVDAVTTLLVPAHRVAYNKAAGAATRERTLRSYVLGYYKAARTETGEYSARPVALRDDSHYSVVLGVFKNVGYTKTVTLAQVFWMTDKARQPRRFYVAAERDLSIVGEFSRFGNEIAQLRRKLRQRHLTVWDTFPPYGAWFRRRFGIHHEQALELFHQTVSMKSVGNLTDFVRRHMLERFQTGPQITALIEHFDDLTRAHEAVLKAKRQIELLTPLIERCDRYDSIAAKIRRYRRCYDALEPYFAGLKLELLTTHIASDVEAQTREAAKIARCKSTLNSLRDKEGDLTSAIAKSGGDRLNQLDSQIRKMSSDRERRMTRADRYKELLSRVDASEPGNADAFTSQRRQLDRRAGQLRARQRRLAKSSQEVGVRVRQGQIELEQVSAEVHSLKARESNIPAVRIEMRRGLCDGLGIEESALPFAGELIAVRSGESAWEGAAERLLRDFGLSLLVPDGEYARVADWVATNLHGDRMIYFRVRHRREHVTELHRDSIVKKLQIKSDSPFFDWLGRELARRFDMACCTSHEQFLAEPSAVTKAGHIKEFGERHELDNRYRIDDRTRYVLGWTNAAKLKVLKADERARTARLEASRQEIRKFTSEVRALGRQIESLSELRGISSFRDIDWRSLATEISKLTDERNQLESASDVLKRLTDELAQVKHESRAAQAEWLRRNTELARIEAAIQSQQEQRDEAQGELDRVDPASLADDFAKLTEIRTERLGAYELTLRGCENAQRNLRDWLDEIIKRESKKNTRLRDRIILSMTEYNREYSLESSETDAHIDSAPDYRRMLQELEEDDLPSFEARFKKLLNENTIREIANFQAQLDRERETIKERIEIINGSLSQLPYNRNRYIRLEGQPTPDQEIANFRRQLRTCTEGSLTGSEDDQYSEAKFERVKQVIDRFRGREGQAETDRRWTAKVTDVRNWFVFGASERRAEDDSEYEHYSDSSGKSGGQKEKLAYTILAASLTYQFGLERGAVRSRSFRFVVIDEAFGRGSDESAEFALTLFSKLNLQLLIATPLQKIYVIEPFVESVGFVDIKDDRDSRLRNLSIREYQEEKRLLRDRPRPGGRNDKSAQFAA